MNDEILTMGIQTSNATALLREVDSPQCLQDTCNCQIKYNAYCVAYCQHEAIVEAYRQQQPWYADDAVVGITTGLIICLVIGVAIWITCRIWE